MSSMMKLASAAIRGLIIAPPGKQLVVSDLSNIEGRIVAWLAGEEWKITAFGEYDAGRGEDIYKLTAAGILNKPAKEVTKAERNAYGKVSELACGYEGGAGAFLTFANGYQIDMGALWPTTQVNLPTYAEQAQDNLYRWGPRGDGFPGEKWPDEYRNDEKAWLAGETIKLGWRARHPATKTLWLQLREAATQAIAAPGKVVFAGPKLRLKAHTHQGNLWLFMALPSGRYVCYFDPKIDGTGWTYMGVDTKQGSPTYSQWIRMHNFGGRMLEQATQSTARDVLYDAMPRIEAAGFRIVMHVHDEVVTEADPDRTAEELSAILATGETWTAGLPLAAAGFECDRYRKEA
jgi:DNA polymerase bacteriophage-type